MEYTTYAEINLDQYEENFRHVKEAIGDTVGLCILAKADAYGHGMIQISRKAEQLGASYIAVATVEEGIVLRKAGISIPILTLNAMLSSNIQDAILNDIILTVFSVKNVKTILKAAQFLHRRANIHIQMDTGMNRVGVATLEELDTILALLKNAQEYIALKGLYTHFVESDAQEKSFAQEQYKQFQQAVNLSKEYGFSLLLHTSNSGGVLDLPFARFDMVRPGLLLYGYYPSAYVKKDIVVKPVMSVYTHVVQVHSIPPGISVGYDRTWFSKRKTTIATISVGYGDGYKRLLSNRGQAIVCGVKVPIIGRISMDLAMLDVTDAENVTEGTKVVLLGSENGLTITADDIASWAETIPYEILLSFSQRVPRVYMENGVRL